MVPKSSETNYLHRNKLSRSFLLPIILLAAILVQTAQAQVYREWRDTTLPEMRTPRRLGLSGQPTFPIGLFDYGYDANRPYSEIVHYMNLTGIDHLIKGVRKDYDGYRNQNNWLRYTHLLDTLEYYGKRMVPLIDYGGYNDIPSYVIEGEHAREIIFYPFDSSQMQRWGVYQNLFTDYSYDSTTVNLNYVDPRDSTAPREAIYNPGSMANQTVASGIAFNYKPGQSGRFDNGSSPVNSTAMFEHVEYATWNSTDNKWEGDRFHTHRSPHFLVVTGHLFEGGTANDNDTLLRINVWYDVDSGKTYYDSSGVLQTAGSNLHFLYKTVGVTRGELKPVDLGDPNFNEYRDAIKRVSFRREGMGGPTDTGVTAQRFDLEVVYLGGEKLALRSVALRDSIANLLVDPSSAGDNYRLNIEREIDTLTRYSAGTSSLRPSIYNLNIADEPFYTQFAGFREVKKVVERKFSDDTDTLTTLNGTALPFIQWLGGADWMVSGNYLGNTFYHLGNEFGLNRVVNGNTLLYQDVPSVKQHNGGQWHIPQLFDFNTITDPDTAASLPDRIEHMELLWNHARMGAATPGQNLTGKFSTSWRVRGLQISAALARELGRPFQNYIGPVSNISISYQNYKNYKNDYDTNCDHRFERAELRAIIGLGLAYGAKGMTFYKIPTYPWGRKDDKTTDNHVLGHILSDQEIGVAGFNVADTVNNVIDWTIADPNIGNAVVVNNTIIYDSIGVVPGLYVGYRNTYREMKESVAWLKRIGPVMATLTWRDAYSVFFQTDLPSSNYDNSGITHRPLPSNEIITEVKASHPITGKVDSAYATYVEVGLFDTKIDTAGGVRNRLKDTNYVCVVNRRVFETSNYDSADIGYSSATKALLDTLSETRTIRLKLNMLDYDLANSQYQYLRVRQIIPDTAHLPLIGKPSILDTIVAADGNIEIILGSGRACLLQITRMPPDESIVDGLLTRNNQRKILYEPSSHRYFATYHRLDTISGDYHVYYRRSIPVDTTGTILWEPFEWALSKQMQGGDSPRTLNTNPSLTYRRLPSGALRVSVVWTAHPNGSNHPATEREILIRDLTYRTYVNGNGDTVKVMQSTPLRNVGFHYGRNAEEWGTPVMSSAGFGDYVAWSDSTVGIVACARLLDTAIVFTPVWTPRDTVNKNLTDTIHTPPGQFPTMPPFTHRGLNDSSAGIAWQQQWGTATGPKAYIGIFYGRLYYVPPPTGPTVLLGYLPYNLYISPGEYNADWSTDQYLHPSIDQSQDALGRVMEGVTWERHYYIPEQNNFITDIYFRSILFDTASRKPALMGQWINQTDATFSSPDPGFGYPVVSSQNQVTTLGDSTAQPYFSVVYMKDDYVEPMNILEAGWRMGMTPVWKTAPTIHRYDFGGATPNGVASDGKLTSRYASLYRRATDNLLRTSRQFFSRARPEGYQAEGVEISAMVEDSLRMSVTARLYDVWKSDASSSGPVGIAPAECPDSLHQMLSLLHSRMFETSDSVEIGAIIDLRLFSGDSVGSMGREIHCFVELVDSATGEVAIVLDTTSLDVSDRERYILLDRTVDLLSGTYYLRLRLESEGWETCVALDNTTKQSIGYVYGWIPASAAKRAFRLDGEAGSGTRITAQPNPFTKRTEVRFSIPRQDYVTVTVYDALGRKVETLASRELYGAGRYAVELDGSGLPGGTYLIELRTSFDRVVEKVVVGR